MSLSSPYNSFHKHPHHQHPPCPQPVTSLDGVCEESKDHWNEVLHLPHWCIYLDIFSILSLDICCVYTYIFLVYIIKKCCGDIWLKTIWRSKQIKFLGLRESFKTVIILCSTEWRCLCLFTTPSDTSVELFVICVLCVTMQRTADF